MYKLKHVLISVEFKGTYFLQYIANSIIQLLHVLKVFILSIVRHFRIFKQRKKLSRRVRI